MDWFEDMQTQLIIYPRGIARDGIVQGNKLHWTSHFGNIVAAAYESITTNGMNEHGLAVHILGLDENVKQYAGLGGDKPLSGVTYPSDGFVRATYYLAHMSDVTSDRDAVFKLLSIMQNAGQPSGTLSPERSKGGHIYESVWRSVSDLTHKVYYFNSTTSFNIFWVRLSNFNLGEGAPVMKLDLKRHEDLAFDAGKYFVKG